MKCKLFYMKERPGISSADELGSSSTLFSRNPQDNVKHVLKTSDAIAMNEEPASAMKPITSHQWARDAGDVERIGRGRFRRRRTGRLCWQGKTTIGGEAAARAGGTGPRCVGPVSARPVAGTGITAGGSVGGCNRAQAVVRALVDVLLGSLGADAIEYSGGDGEILGIREVTALETDVGAVAGARERHDAVDRDHRLFADDDKVWAETDGVALNGTVGGDDERLVLSDGVGHGFLTSQVFVGIED